MLQKETDSDDIVCKSWIQACLIFLGLFGVVIRLVSVGRLSSQGAACMCS